MRSVKIDRKTRGGRPKAGRKSAREQRERAAAQAARGRRVQQEEDDEDDGRFSGLVGRLKDKFSLRRPALILTLVFLLLVLIGALFAGGYVRRSIDAVNTATDTMMTQAGFGIASVNITGNTRTPPETILAALGFAPGQSIFDADLQAARARLLALDWVKDADVVRRYPDTIHVRLIEKLPFALWQSGDTIWIVERSGGRITTEDVVAYAHLPFLMGEGAPQLAADMVDAVAARRALSARVKAFERQSQRRWNLLLDNKVVVKLPETNWQKELDVLERLIIDNGVLERDIVEIDLRDASRFFFVLRGGEKKDVKRGNAA